MTEKDHIENALRNILEQAGENWSAPTVPTSQSAPPSRIPVPHYPAVSGVNSTNTHPVQYQAAADLLRENEQLRQGLAAARTTACTVCWTNSWQPCEEGYPNALKDPTTSGWMFCGYCQLQAGYERISCELTEIIAHIYDISAGTDNNGNCLKHPNESPDWGEFCGRCVNEKLESIDKALQAALNA